MLISPEATIDELFEAIEARTDAALLIIERDETKAHTDCEVSFSGGFSRAWGLVQRADERLREMERRRPKDFEVEDG